MNASFEFLDESERETLREVLGRRDPALFARIARESDMSRNDAELIVSTLADEFMNGLDNDWEPTPYGTTISALLQRVNAARWEAM
jgi:hypothetical protein